MGPVTAVAGFSLLLVSLAFAVQRQSPIYRGIVGTGAVIATLMTTLSYVELAPVKQPSAAVAHTGPVVEKVATTVCVRQGIVPACNCARQQ
jgi:hypothetical protein